MDKAEHRNYSKFLEHYVKTSKSPNTGRKKYDIAKKVKVDESARKAFRGAGFHAGGKD